MDPGIGEQLVDIAEAPDSPISAMRVARSRADAGDGLEPSCQLRIEQGGDMDIGLADLSFEQVVLVEQHPDLEAHLGLELGHRDAVGRGGLQALGLRLPEASMARPRVGIGEGARVLASGDRGVGAMRRTSRAVRQAGSSTSSPSSGSPARRGGPGADRRGPVRSRASSRPCRLARLDTDQRVAGDGVFAHGLRASLLASAGSTWSATAGSWQSTSPRAS